MDKYKVVLFDLDGTLVESGDGIVNGMMYTLNRFGLPVPPREELYAFVGPSLFWAMEQLGIPKEQVHEAVRVYREYYSEKGLFEMRVYDGIPELLHSLKRAGRIVIMATSKLERFANRLMEHIGETDSFDYIAGSLPDGSRISKDDIIAYALESVGVSDRTSAVMVGDRDSDILAAKKLGMDSIGAAYGYGSREELQTAGATYIADTTADVGAFILG